MDPWNKEWFDYYAVLHLGFTASPAQIAAARRTLAGKHNVRLGEKPNQDQMRQINIAYNTLFDPAARKRYDAAYLSRNPHLRPPQPPPRPNPPVKRHPQPVPPRVAPPTIRRRFTSVHGVLVLVLLAYLVYLLVS